MKKALILCLCIIAVLSAALLGTLAWLTDSETARNTFTVGNVDIRVDEAAVREDGTPIAGADRVSANTYHLLPGQTYTKDPTVTVAGSSEEAYVRMLLTLSCKSQLDAIFGADAEIGDIFAGYDASVWLPESAHTDTAADTATYEFRYKESVDPNGSDTALDALFDSFTLPGTLDGDELKALEGLTITVTGHAIQAAGFETADEAWLAFDRQHNP